MFCRQVTVACSILVFFLGKGEYVSAEDATTILKDVDKLIMAGRSSYDRAVLKLDTLLKNEPSNLKALFKRAEVNSILKKDKEALTDLNILINLSSEAKHAYQLRAKIHSREGMLHESYLDYKALANIYSKSSSKHEREKKYKDAVASRDKLYSLVNDVARMRSNLSRKPQGAAAAYRDCVDTLTRVLDYAKDSHEIRRELLNCALEARDYDKINNEISRVLAVDPHNVDAIHMKAVALKSMGAIDAALQNIKKCLKINPDHENCYLLFKKLKAYTKLTKKFDDHVEKKKWSDVLASVDESLALDKDPHNLDRLMHYRCESHHHLRMLEQGVKSCEVAINTYGVNNPNTWKIYLLRANIHMTAGDLQKAEEDLTKADHLQQNQHELHEARHRLQKLKKRASRKNYYQILGVKPTSTDKQITKAYRKLAMKHHPDKLDKSSMSTEEYDKAEQLYKDISESYQVLKDKEKRRRYDLGEDVEDNNSGGGGHHGFPQGFHPGGFRFTSGGFSF